VAVTVRATVDGSCVASSGDRIAISFAEEDVRGGVYYWQSGVIGGELGQAGGIYSYDFGAPAPMAAPFTPSSKESCVGCHTLSRDGARMVVGLDDPDADDEMLDIFTVVMDVKTGTRLGGASLLDLIRDPNAAVIPPGFQTFTHDHRKLITTSFPSFANRFGPFPRPGPGLPPGLGPRQAGNRDFIVFDGDGRTRLASMTIGNDLAGTQPDLSPDDRALVFVVPRAGTISLVGDHHFHGGSIYRAAFDAAANELGTAQPMLLAGPDESFYYPSFSPTGEFLVINALSRATPTDDAFYNRRARVALLRFPPPAGARPIELPALNAPALGDKLTNSWPKWSPFVQSYQGHKLLWVTFSSNRDYGLRLPNRGLENCYPPESPEYDQPQLGPNTGGSIAQGGPTPAFARCAQPQIWMAAIVVDPEQSDGADRSFPAFWLPFQDVTSHNHTAQWVEQLAGTPPAPTPPPIIP
jgi:hypothetical protein